MIMSGLQEYLVAKRKALLQRADYARVHGPGGLHTLSARVKAEDRSGVRRIRIRDFQIISDSGPDFAGYNLGPGSPELQMGVLGSCLTHIFLIQPADRQVPLDSLEVEVNGQQDPRANTPGFEHIPVYPHNITYTVHITSSASDQELADLHAAVERVCPIFNLLVNPQQITGTITHTLPDL
jgi:uncharacterized OsmC-like protein